MFLSRTLSRARTSGMKMMSTSATVDLTGNFAVHNMPADQPQLPNESVTVTKDELFKVIHCFQAPPN